MNMGIWSDIILGVIGIAFIWFFAYVGFYLRETRDINKLLASIQFDKKGRILPNSNLYIDDDFKGDDDNA